MGWEGGGRHAVPRHAMSRHTGCFLGPETHVGLSRRFPFAHLTSSSPHVEAPLGAVFLFLPFAVCLSPGWGHQTCSERDPRGMQAGGWRWIGMDLVNVQW